LTDMGLTKINYTARNFNDGLPVTVRFADKVGDVLSMGSAKGERPDARRGPKMADNPMRPAESGHEAQPG
jgi:hypothetical protein